jgi:ATPase complex subunit ATP10
MLGTMILSRIPLRPSNIGFESAACIACQWRSFTVSYWRLAEKGAPPAPSPTATPEAPSPPPSPLAEAPRSYGKAVSEFTPKPLSRPIGLNSPPRPGENAGVDTRTWKQRRDDFVDYEKHLVRRKQL